MKQEYFELIKMVLQIIFFVLSIFVYPYVAKWLKENTSKEQRDNAIFWIKYITKMAEDIYKRKGAGTLKKSYVLKWLNENGIKLSDEQMSILIDMIVAEYNKKGWDSPVE